MIWEAAHSPVPLLAETKHPPGRETRMGSPSLLLMPSHVPVGSPGASPSAPVLWAQGREPLVQSRQVGCMAKCQAVLCLTAAAPTEPHSGLEPPLVCAPSAPWSWDSCCASALGNHLGIKAAFRLWMRVMQLGRISNVHTLSWEQRKSCYSAGSVLSSLGNSWCHRKAKVSSSNFCSVIGIDIKMSWHCKPLQSAYGKQQCLETSRAGVHSSYMMGIHCNT